MAVNNQRTRRLGLIFLMLFLLAGAIGLVLYALRSNINLFYTPSQIALEHIKTHQIIRLGGIVEVGSVKRSADSVALSFNVTDFTQTITVYYQGILPDLFREGQSVVVLGTLRDNEHFLAQQVLAKHDENYTPPELAQSLSKKSINP